VSPATPVVELIPSGVASPKAWASSSTSAIVAPGSTHATRAAGSMRTERMAEWSMTMPPSHTAVPAMLWPPPRIDTRSSCSRAMARARAVSADPAHRATSAGRRSIDPFQTARASS
jgi:hypothetical protein